MLSWACSKSVSAPPPPVPVDPPAAVHVVNTTGGNFNAWTLIVGADLNHSGLAFGGSSEPLVHPGNLCLRSGQASGERRSSQIAVAENSTLDSILRVFSTDAPSARAWVDSVRQGQINLGSWVAAHPGLVAATPLFDPAPASWPPTGWPVAAPNDTVPWTWTVSGPGATTVVVDTT